MFPAFSTMTRLVRRGMQNRFATLALSGAAALAVPAFSQAAPAAGRFDRDNNRVERRAPERHDWDRHDWDRHDWDRHDDDRRGGGGVNIDLRIGDRRPAYEVREERVWVPPVYRTVHDRRWVEPVYRTETERVWVADRFEDREVRYQDRSGRWCTRIDRVLVDPGHYETRDRQVCVVEGHWEDVERQELVGAGHYEVRTDRVRVADRTDGFGIHLGGR